MDVWVTRLRELRDDCAREVERARSRTGLQPGARRFDEIHAQDRLVCVQRVRQDLDQLDISLVALTLQHCLQCRIVRGPA